MPRNGSGTMSLATPQQAPGNPITAVSLWNTCQNDIANELTNSLPRDGQAPPTANLPMGGFKLTGMGSGSAATDSATLAQVQSGAVTLLGGVGGTVDVITASASPAIAAYAAGQTFRFISTGANTTAVTLNLNGLGAKAVTKQGTTALAAGDIPSGAVVQVVYDGTQFQLTNVGSLTPILTSVTLGSGANQTALTATTDTRTSSTTARPLLSYENTTNDADAVTMMAFKSRAGLTTSNNDPFFHLYGYGRDTGNLSRLACEFRMRQSAAAGATFVQGAFAFYATNSAGSFAERVVIDESGLNVSSGTLKENNTRAFSRNSMAESGELGLANNTTYSYAHGFGAVPKLYMAVLRCKTAELGYAIGDEVQLCSWVNTGSNVSSVVWPDATNINARINSSAANNYSLARISSNDSAGITYANWKIVLRAWY